MLLHLDVAHNIYIEAILRQPEWQTKIARTSTKAIIKGALAMQKASERDENRSNIAAPGVPRKNLDSALTTINSKKLSQKKIKLVTNSTSINNSIRIQIEAIIKTTY